MVKSNIVNVHNELWGKEMLKSVAEVVAGEVEEGEVGTKMSLFFILFELTTSVISEEGLNFLFTAM